MDITQFNKELANKIASAKRYEKNGDIKLAIKLWLEISEMTISLSKNTKLDASFRNMLMNRIKGIFEHVKILKSEQLEEEVYIENNSALHKSSELRSSFKSKSKVSQEQEINEKTDSKLINNRSQKIIEDSDLKNLPEGFKEIKTSEDFEIITPHDKDFVQKQLDKALDSDYYKIKKQEDSERAYKQPERLNFDLPKDGKNKICFACGYDKNLIKDKICRNCGINLD